MYEAESVHTTEPLAGPSEPTGRVSRNVWCLGLTSLLTDVSSEMITAVLPVYLIAQQGFSPLVFGTIDGLQHGVSAVVRWVGGVAGDRSGRHKEAAAAGYGISAAAKLGWLTAGGAWPLVAMLVVVDRAGKGLRTAPRDALISLSSASSGIARAFGVHRALDAAGALAGPALAFALLAGSPGRFDMLFIVSFAAAMAGLGVLLLFVRNQASSSVPAARRRAGFRDVTLLLSDRPFQRVVFIAGALALTTVSDALFYVALYQQFEFSAHLLPLLFVATSAAYLLLAVPLGHLADRIGRRHVFLAGHAMVLLAYVVLLGPWAAGSQLFWVVPLCLGTYYAATDGVLQALASEHIAPAVRGRGLALVGTVTSVARLLASVSFGWALTSLGREPAVALFGAALLVAIAAAGGLLPRLAHGRPTT